MFYPFAQKGVITSVVLESFGSETTIRLIAVLYPSPTVIRSSYGTLRASKGPMCKADQANTTKHQRGSIIAGAGRFVQDRQAMRELYQIDDLK